jgi:hypothetical protein
VTAPSAGDSGTMVSRVMKERERARGPKIAKCDEGKHGA